MRKFKKHLEILDTLVGDGVDKMSPRIKARIASLLNPMKKTS